MTLETGALDSRAVTIRGSDELADRLEAGEVARFDGADWPLPIGADRDLLRGLRCAWGWKNINFDCASDRLRGAAGATDRALEVMRRFSEDMTAELARRLPSYARGWTPDQATLRPFEEQGRLLPTTARNDLLHVDAFPGRPAGRRCILRVFANIHPDRPRVWRVGPRFPELFARYGADAGLPGPVGTVGRVQRAIAGWLGLPAGRRTPYDEFMLRFHDHLKRRSELQQGPATRLEFAPGEVWAAFTDIASHAVESGQFALEHSYFVRGEDLRFPERSPAAVLAAVERKREFA